MIRIRDKKHFREAMKFSNENTKRGKSLKDCIKQLVEKWVGEDTTMVLTRDFVPHSFIFSFENKDGDASGIMGGIILHGYSDTFTTEIDPGEGMYYSIHT